MKLGLLAFALGLLFASQTTFAQGVGINATGASPDASALLDVASTSMGILIPRMTTVQKNAISSPATGLMIFQTDGATGFYYYTGTAWSAVGSNNLPTGSSGSLLFYNGTSWASLGIGSVGQVLTVNSSGLPVWASTPELTTTSVTAVNPTTAACGGIVASSVIGTVTARGVCWSTSVGPTVSGAHTTNGSGLGAYTSSISGLTANTTYYVCAYATSSAGTTYGNQLSFTTMPAIGASYGGGVLAYVLQSGDPGYDPATPHGLIAATSDQSTGICWDCGSGNFTAAGGVAIGTGFLNTYNIMNETGAPFSASNAASICAGLTTGGYTDWYLPSLDELSKLCANRSAIGGFSAAYYWSSSAIRNSSNLAWWVLFPGGSQGYSGSLTSLDYVRAVRSF